MSRQEPPHSMDPALAEVARALQATPARIAILATLSVDGPQTRGELIERLGIGVSAMQHQLESLRSSGLVIAVPLAEPNHYHRMEFRIDSARLALLYRTLGSGLGVISTG